ncbi:hypothetical protein EXIGLDRAFT_797686 [Exidia glandulosa HHB12029]|uniref:Uncharacterized protein n=1 Tax=Exidia glandulosa HHB12029 TaxID=1314781 RepID=A0A166BDV0_EXIGL|nr:hypothetical protein EXIGLDRAFT_797686 [Exidia glandulosa HHB12029]
MPRLLLTGQCVRSRSETRQFGKLITRVSLSLPSQNPYLCKMESSILEDQFWAKALLLQQEGDLSELDRQSSQLLRQYQADHRTTPAWHVDAEEISGVLYNVLQSLVDTTRRGASDQERNAHKHVVSCICACACDSGDATMDCMASLATTWITCVYWMRETVWDYAPVRGTQPFTSPVADLVLKRDKHRCSITGRGIAAEDRAQVSGLSVDEFDEVLSALNQPSNAITAAAYTADVTFQEFEWGLLETDVKNYYRIQNFSNNKITFHPPLKHVDFGSRGVTPPPDVRLLRFHAMACQVIQGCGLDYIFCAATETLDPGTPALPPVDGFSTDNCLTA